MSNDSSTGGPLAFAATPAPLEGQALFRFLQQFFLGILEAQPGNTITGSTLFPAWQLEPNNLPAVGTDWAAFAVTDRRSDTFAWIGHVAGNEGASPPTQGYDAFQRHEELTIRVSFYGPYTGNTDANAAGLRDALQIRQNLDPLTAQAMQLVETGELITIPELVKNQWLYRVDLSVKIRREIVRQVLTLDLLGAGIELNNELYVTDITVQS